MAITISDVTPRVQYTATSGQTSFTVPFEFFDDDDLVVVNTNSGGVDTTLTKAASPSSVTQYSVTGAGVTGGGSITLGSGATVNDKYTITRNVPIARATDFATTGVFPIDSLNTELDKIVAMMQQQVVDINLSPRAASTTSTAYGLIFPELTANKILSVNSSGNALIFSQEIGNFKGNWSASTAYVQRDIVKDTSTNNIFIANAAHTSSGSQPLTTNTDSAKWDLLVDAASATTSATNAAASATAAASSATTASGHATTATTKAGEAATSATNAASSETAAASSATKLVVLLQLQPLRLVKQVPVQQTLQHLQPLLQVLLQLQQPKQVKHQPLLQMLLLLHLQLQAMLLQQRLKLVRLLHQLPQHQHKQLMQQHLQQLQVMHKQLLKQLKLLLKLLLITLMIHT